MKNIADVTTTQFIEKQLELINSLRKLSTPNSVYITSQISGSDGKLLPASIQKRLQEAVVVEAKIMLKEIEQNLNNYLYGEHSHDQEPELSESSGSNSSSQDGSDVA